MSKSTTGTPANPFADLAKTFSQFQVPGIDMAPIIEARRKDMEVLIAANTSAFEAWQAVARKQIDVFTQTVQGLQEAAQAMASEGGTAPDLKKQTELAQNVYQKALADMTTIAQMVQKAQTEAMESITQRAQQSLDEMRKLMPQQPAAK